MVLKLFSAQRNHCANSPINDDERFKCLSINIKCVGSHTAAAPLPLIPLLMMLRIIAIKFYACPVSLNGAGLRKGSLIKSSITYKGGGWLIRIYI